MAVVTGQLVDTVLQRVRDPGGLAHPRTLVRLVLTHLQRALNTKFGVVLESRSLATVPRQQVYPIAALTAETLRIVAVREGTRDLIQVAWPELWYQDRNWPFRLADHHESFSVIGRDLLVIYPAKPAASTVTLICATLTATLTDDTVVIELQEELHPLLLSLTEAVLLTRQRVYGPLKALTEVITAQVALV